MIFNVNLNSNLGTTGRYPILICFHLKFLKGISPLCGIRGWRWNLGVLVRGLTGEIAGNSKGIKVGFF